MLDSTHSPGPNPWITITDIYKERSQGRHASLFPSLWGLALKTPPAPPPHHGPRLCAFPMGSYIGSGDFNLPGHWVPARGEGGVSLTPGPQQRDLQQANRLPRGQARKTFLYKKPRRTQIPATQPPYPPPRAPNRSPPLGSSGKATILPRQHG